MSLRSILSLCLSFSSASLHIKRPSRLYRRQYKHLSTNRRMQALKAAFSGYQWSSHSSSLHKYHVSLVEDQNPHWRSITVASHKVKSIIIHLAYQHYATCSFETFTSVIFAEILSYRQKRSYSLSPIVLLPLWVSVVCSKEFLKFGLCLGFSQPSSLAITKGITLLLTEENLTHCTEIST